MDMQCLKHIQINDDDGGLDIRNAYGCVPIMTTKKIKNNTKPLAMFVFLNIVPTHENFQHATGKIVQYIQCVCVFISFTSLRESIAYLYTKKWRIYMELHHLHHTPHIHWNH